MDNTQVKPEETYEIEVYKTEKVTVSKDQYSERLRNKLNRRFENVADMTLKMNNLALKLNAEKEQMALLVNELNQLNGVEQTANDLEYSKFRFVELYPAKAKKLKAFGSIT